MKNVRVSSYFLTGWEDSLPLEFEKALENLKWSLNKEGRDLGKDRLIEAKTGKLEAEKDRVNDLQRMIS